MSCYNHKDLDTMARTIFGEARGEIWEGKLAVGHVIKNRYLAMSWYGNSIHGVCMKRWQFSCWNTKDPNRKACEAVQLENDGRFRECYAAAAHVLFGQSVDNTHKSLHYHTKHVWPKWSDNKEPAVIIGNHKFYSNID